MNNMGKGAKMTILEQDQHQAESVDKLREIYKRDKAKARVVALSNYVKLVRLVLFDNGKNNFSIVKEECKYGVSTNYKLYCRRHAAMRWIVNNNKFTYISNLRRIRKHIHQMTYADIADSKEVKRIIYERYKWIKFFEEYNIRDVPFNVCFNRNLFTPNKILSYKYKCNAPLANFLHREILVALRTCKTWRLMVKWIDNLDAAESAGFEIFRDFSFLIDCTAMAEKLNKKVNAAWSAKRLEQEHDRWAREINDILFEENSRDLHIAPVFLEFDKFLGGGFIIKDTKGLALEGQLQQNCVANYANSIDRGQCAIYNYKGYTTEIVETSGLLVVRQIRGFRNVHAPEKIKNELRERIMAWQLKAALIENKGQVPIIVEQELALPF